jgi:hypothetical protein
MIATSRRRYTNLINSSLFPCTFRSHPAEKTIIPLRELSHAPWLRELSHAPLHVCELIHARWSVVKTEEQTFFVFGQFFNIQSTRFFTTLMVFITYTIITTYKYPSIPPYYLTPYHFLSILTFSLYFSSYFLFFNSLFGGKSDQIFWGKIVTSPLGEKEINILGKIKFASFYPKTFYRG